MKNGKSGGSGIATGSIVCIYRWRCGFDKVGMVGHVRRKCESKVYLLVSLGSLRQQVVFQQLNPGEVLRESRLCRENTMGGRACLYGVRRDDLISGSLGGGLIQGVKRFAGADL